MNSVQFLRFALDTVSGYSNERLKKLKTEHEALVKAAGTKFEVLARKCSAGMHVGHGPSTLSTLTRSTNSRLSFGKSMSV
jgi:hypothetical protein